MHENQIEFRHQWPSENFKVQYKNCYDVRLCEIYQKLLDILKYSSTRFSCNIDQNVCKMPKIDDIVCSFDNIVAKCASLLTETKRALAGYWALTPDILNNGFETFNSM